MMPASDPRDRLRDYAAEFLDLVRTGATKAQMRNGANGKHGLNHVVEAFTMLPETGQSAEFKIRE